MTVQINASSRLDIAGIFGSPGGVFRLLAPDDACLAQRSVDRDYDRLVALKS